MNLRSRIPAIAMIAAFLFPVAALAIDQSTVTLNEGDEIHAAMNATLDSGNAYVGQRFTAQVIPPFPEGDYDLDGATVNGKVIKVVPAGQGTNPELDLAFTSITLANGTTYPLSAQMTAANTKQQNRNAGHVAMTTAGGAIVGNVVAKTLFHAATGIGGLLGAVAGGLIGYNKKSNVTLGAQAQITLTLTRPLLVRRQARQPE